MFSFQQNLIQRFCYRIQNREMSCISGLGEDEVSSFFESSPPLKNMEEIVQKLNAFIHLNSSAGGRRRRIVCVTSGGTTVPLEQRCVRYIDNFSSGNRGAASTEYVFTSSFLFFPSFQSLFHNHSFFCSKGTSSRLDMLSFFSLGGTTFINSVLSC